MYHIDDWYYLVAAEGGTGYTHAVTMARSGSLFGPFETMPGNPVITSCREDMSMLQKCGHGDLVDTPDGEWYMVHLCSRPVPGTQWCTLGRETAIQKMIWDDDGWLRMECGGNFGQMTTASPEAMSEAECRERPPGFFDDFDAEELDVRYASPRADYHSFIDLSSRRGYLRIRGKESINSLHHVSHLAVRQQEFICTAETEMEFDPESYRQMAGLTYGYDALCFYMLCKTLNEDGRAVLCLLKSDGGNITDEMNPVLLPAGKRIALRVEIIDEGRKARFSYRQPDGEWQCAGPDLSTELVSDEYARGFTGAHFGLYVHDMDSMRVCADFDSFSVSC